MKRFFLMLFFLPLCYGMESDVSGDLPETQPLLSPIAAEADNGYEQLDALLSATSTTQVAQCVDFIYGGESDNRNADFLRALLARRASQFALKRVMPRLVTRSRETDKDLAMKELIQILVESQQAETEAEREQSRIMKEKWEAEKADRLVEAHRARRAMIINGIMFFYSSVSTVVNFLQAYNLFSFGH